MKNHYFCQPTLRNTLESQTVAHVPLNISAASLIAQIHFLVSVERARKNYFFEGGFFFCWPIFGKKYTESSYKSILTTYSSVIYCCKYDWKRILYNFFFFAYLNWNSLVSFIENIFFKPVSFTSHVLHCAIIDTTEFSMNPFISVRLQFRSLTGKNIMYFLPGNRVGI